ncbi:hypothetical protein B0H14DRAFT_2718869 [Mycena olivaceomarginata]|nr:hypothetical protein B0H14DRAFT_2718869 [Mycena olivaceomarginata]
MSLTTVSSASRYHAPRPRRPLPTMGFTDLFSPMVAGLALRVVLDAATFHDVKLSATFVGLWEGVVLNYYVKHRKPSEPAYLAYAIRVLVDFSVTESIFKLVVVLLWTTMGMVLADVAPAAWTETGAKRQWSRFRHDLSRSLRILLTRGPTAMASEDATPATPVVPKRPVKRPVPGTFPGAEWSETETRPGTVVEEDEEEYDDEAYEDEYEDEDVDEDDEGLTSEEAGAPPHSRRMSLSSQQSYRPLRTIPTHTPSTRSISPPLSNLRSGSMAPIIVPPASDDSHTFSLTTPPQSP